MHCVSLHLTAPLGPYLVFFPPVSICGFSCPLSFPMELSLCSEPVIGGLIRIALEFVWTNRFHKGKGGGDAIQSRGSIHKIVRKVRAL